MIIKTFNLTYFLLLLFLAAITIIVSFLAKNKSDEVKKRILLGLCFFNVFLFLVYKIDLAFGAETLKMSGYEFIIWTELPLHLCNISLFLVPIGIILKNDKLKAYGFYVAPLAAMLALTFPNPEFTNTNLFYFHNIGFYFTHGLIIVNGVLLVTLGFFKPNFKIIPFLLILMVILSILAFLVSLLINKLTGCFANYFYTVGPEGVSILESIYKIIPIPYLYITVTFLLFGVVSSLMTLPFYLKQRGHHE